ncbi:hypothetical protein K438DRAFT_2014277 [Mycena galopus ATCC 62051]|nr:hypothetical protein K438DRAFT_2014277 [Mycena galopus ATCC 62051]
MPNAASTIYPVLLLPHSVLLPSESCIASNSTTPQQSPNASTSSDSKPSMLRRTHSLALNDKAPRKIKLEAQTQLHRSQIKCPRLSSPGSPSLIASMPHHMSASRSTSTSRSMTPSLSRFHTTSSIPSLPSLPSRDFSPFIPMSIILLQIITIRVL